MNTIIGALREVAGLFVDDGSLALTIVIVVVLAAIVAALAPEAPIAAGLVLLAGCLGALFDNVSRAARR